MFSFDKTARAALRSSLLWGALVSLAFYVALQKGQDWISPLVLRYLAGRWEAYACVSMFFIGLAAIVIKAIDLGQGWFFFHRLNLGPPTGGDINAAGVKALIRQLDGQPRLCQTTYLYRRLRDAFEFVLRKGGQESLEGHLRYLADIDAARMNTSYGLPRFLCWAIPAVGSLGAVLGIAVAIGQLSMPAPAAQPAAEAPLDMFSGVTSGLALAFDTMALAIGLSILLMLFKFACEHAESQLLDAVEERAEREVNERAGNLVASRGSQADQMRYLAERLGELTEKLSAASSLGTAGQTGASNEQIEAIVSRAVAKTVAGQPSVTIAGGGQLTDMSHVQEALKQIAAFFSIQQAEHQQESEIVRQLSEIIREGENANWKPRKQNESLAGSIAGLWNALSD
jgi:hypothetical protein